MQTRVGNKSMGFGANIQSVKEIKIGNILSELHTEDLIKFGLIPEFIGRIPIIAVLEEPISRRSSASSRAKNALIKQFQEDFLVRGRRSCVLGKRIAEIANIAMQKESGARGPSRGS